MATNNLTGEEMNVLSRYRLSPDVMQYVPTGFLSANMVRPSSSSIYDQADYGAINAAQRERNIQSTIRSAQAAARKAQEEAARNAAFEGRMDQMVKMADPFASQRSQYQTQLSDLLTNPAAALESNPFFKASAEQGQESAMRRLRQLGMGNSGNAALELQKASQANMAQQFFPMAQLLGGFAGANANPAAASGAMSDMLRLRESQRQFDVGATDKPVRWMWDAPSTPASRGFSAYWGG